VVKEKVEKAPDYSLVALGGEGREMIAFYLSEALDVPIEVFEKMLREGDLVSIDMCMWVASSIKEPGVFEDDAVAARVRAQVRALTGWAG
jgi:hypothetical protein